MFFYGSQDNHPLYHRLISYNQYGDRLQRGTNETLNGIRAGRSL